MTLIILYLIIGFIVSATSPVYKPDDSLIKSIIRLVYILYILFWPIVLLARLHRKYREQNPRRIKPHPHRRFTTRYPKG